MWFEYGSIKLSDIPVEYLKATGEVGLRPIGILARGGATRSEMEALVSELGSQEEYGLLALSRLFADLVFKQADEQDWIERMFAMFTDPFAETPTYQRLVRQGREQGLQEGLEQGLQQGKQEGLQQGKQEGKQEGLQQGLQQGKQEGLQQGKQEGLQQGLQQGLQTAVIDVIRVKFPSLTPLARQKVPKETKPDALNLLLKAVVITPDETAVRILLESLAA